MNQWPPPRSVLGQSCLHQEVWVVGWHSLLLCCQATSSWVCLLILHRQCDHTAGYVDCGYLLGSMRAQWPKYVRRLRCNTSTMSMSSARSFMMSALHTQSLLVQPKIFLRTDIILSSSKIQNGDILVPAYPGCPWKWPLNKCCCFFT